LAATLVGHDVNVLPEEQTSDNNKDRLIDTQKIISFQVTWGKGKQRSGRLLGIRKNS
jgi:hypothetical protein